MRPTPERLEEIRAEVNELGVAAWPCESELLAEIDALRARVRELESAQDGLVARFHAECCETECKCHCDELRAALAPT